jgi:hypothetical protein
LFEAYERVEDTLGLDQNSFLTQTMMEEMEQGIRQNRPLAFVSFSPKPRFMSIKYIVGDHQKPQSEHDVFPVPTFTKTLNIKGVYLGLIYVSSYAGVPATDQDLQNAVSAFSKENLSPYFPKSRIYLVNVPDGAGINVGVKTESASTGIFGSIGFPIGSASGGVGASHTENNGDTRYATTLGRQVLVFADNGQIPIHLDFRTPVPQEKVVKTPEPVQEQRTQKSTQEVVVWVLVDTGGAQSTVPYRQKAGYASSERKKRRNSSLYMID